MSQFLKLHQSVQLRQEMRINPRLYQAMELLYMPMLDLEQYLKQEVAENPLLELEDADVEQEVELKEDTADEPMSDDGIDWEEILLDGFEVGGRREQYEHREHFERTPVDMRDLHDHLHDQLRLLSASERELRMGEEILGNINDAGMLACGLDEVVRGVNGWLAEVRPTVITTAESIDDEAARAAELEDIAEVFKPYVIEEAQAMLDVIQGFDPPGIAARNVRESILIQLKLRDEEGELTYLIVRDHFDALFNHRWTELSKELGVQPIEVQDAADAISHLDPKPGLKYAPDQEHYVIPDLIVEEIDGEYMVFANDTSVPRLRISQSYRDIAQDKKHFTGENKEFISSRLNSARWMIQAI